MLGYEEDVPNRNGEVNVVFELFAMLLDGATKDGRVNDIEQIGWKFGIDYICMWAYVPICGSVNGDTLPKSIEIGTWVVFRVQLVQVYYCPLIGVNGGTQN